MLTVNKFVSLVFFVIALIIVGVFFSNMKRFDEKLSESTDTITCLEGDNRIIVSEEECFQEYSGTPVYRDFDNVPQIKVCCQLPK